MDGRRARWQQHNDERRQRIIDAAIVLFEEEGPNVTLQAVGERAGLSRSVVYRHFADRRELDIAAQAQILQGLWALLVPQLKLAGSIRETVERGVRVYVGWAVQHPHLHEVADADTYADGKGALQQGIDMISARIVELLVTGVEVLGLEVGDDDRAAADPLVYGLVGMIFGAVRRWVHLGEYHPSGEVMAKIISDSVIALLDSRMAAFGIELDPDAPLDSLLPAQSIDG